jgi:hypothetical protein
VDTTTPEPGTWLLMIAGCALLLINQRWLSHGPWRKSCEPGRLPRFRRPR